MRIFKEKIKKTCKLLQGGPALSERSKSKGFTLIEMIATASIFVVLITILTGVLVTIIRTQKRNNAQRTIQQESKNVLDTITREAKLVSGSDSCLPFTIGDNPPYNTDGGVDGLTNAYTTGSQLILTNGSDYKTYFLDESSGYGIVKITEEMDLVDPTKPDFTKAQRITSENVNITELKFEMSSKSVALAAETKPEIQPFINITLSLESRKDMPSTRVSTILTTTISSLNYIYPQNAPQINPPPSDFCTEYPSDSFTVALWHFNEGTDQITVNAEGDSALNGQLGSTSDADGNDPTWTTFGKFNNALDYGTNKYVKVSDNSRLNFGTDNDFIVEAWIKTSSASDQIIYQKGASSGTQPGYRFKVKSNGKIRANINHYYREDDTDYYTETFIWSENTVIDGNWHHVAFTADRDGDAQIYIDGVPDGSPVSIDLPGTIDTTSDVLMGYAGGSLPFNGTIDEVRVSNKIRDFSDCCDVVTNWAKAYGDTGHEHLENIRHTSDGGYILGAQTRTGLSANGVLLIKTDSDLNFQWEKTYDLSSWDYVMDVVQTSDDGYIVCGHSISFSSKFDAFLLKTDSDGDFQWAKRYPNTLNYHEYGGSVNQLSNGGYMFMINVEDPGFNYTYYLVKTDSSGNVGAAFPETWIKHYTFAGGDIASYGIHEASDGGYFIGGASNNWGFSIIKIDSGGNLQWAREYIGDNWEWMSKMIEVPGGYVLGGYTGSFGVEGNDFLVIKTLLDGTVEWAKTYGYTEKEFFYNLFATEDGGYIFNGDCGTFFTGTEIDSLIIKTDENGNLGTSYDDTWAKRFIGPDGWDRLWASTKKDNKYIFAGWSTSSFGTGGSDIFMLATDIFGKFCCDEMQDVESLVNVQDVTSQVTYTPYSPTVVDFTDLYNVFDTNFNEDSFSSVITPVCPD